MAVAALLGGTVQAVLILSVAPLSIEVAAQAGSTRFNLSNTGNGALQCSLRLSVVWLGVAVGPTGVVTVAYAANPYAIARTGTVTVTSSGAQNSPQVVTIVQRAKAGGLPFYDHLVLSVTPSQRRLGPRAGRTSFKIANLGSTAGGGNMPYRAKSSSSWLSLANGATAGTLVANCLTNPGPGARTVTVTATGANGTPRRVKIVQAGQP